MISVSRSRRIQRVLIQCAFLGLSALAVSGFVLPVEAIGTSSSGFCSEPSLSVGNNPPPFRVRLGLNVEAVVPGRSLRLRVENRGSESVTYGYAYRLARRKDGLWVNQPVGPFLGAKLFAPAGTAGPCQEVHISRDTLPGLYRVTKKILSAGSVQREPRIIRVTFQVRHISPSPT